MVKKKKKTILKMHLNHTLTSTIVSDTAAAADYDDLGK